MNLIALNSKINGCPIRTALNDNDNLQILNIETIPSIVITIGCMEYKAQSNALKSL